MGRETSNSWNHLGVRRPDGGLEALPFRAWIYEPDWHSKMKHAREDLRLTTPLFRGEWHTLNLKTGEIGETLSTMPHEARQSGTAVAWGSRIYVLGGSGGGDPFSPFKIFYSSRYNNCVFYFDCASPDCGWKEAPPMLVRRQSPSAVATGGKIFVFGSCTPGGISSGGHLGHFAEVFDIHQNRWEELPAPPVASCLVPDSVCDHVLFDSSRSRILVHFYSNGSLYAFHPHSGSWECLNPKFGLWSNDSVIVDDVAYFLYEPVSEWIADWRMSLHAYHVVDQKWLPIQWHSDSTLPILPYPNLFHIGNGIICFVFYSELDNAIAYIKLSVRFYDGKVHAILEPALSTTILPFQSHKCEFSMLS